MPQASAIILTYNRLQLLKQAVASACAQTISELEIIVVDNGSTDGTRAWIRQADDDRIVCICLPTNVNPTRARNEGLRVARGNWISFLDDDDLWAPDTLHQAITKAEASQSTWAYSGCVYIDNRSRIIAGRPSPSPDVVALRTPIEHTVPGGMSALLWRRDALSDNELDERITYPIDWDMTNRLLRTGTPAYVDFPHIGNRQHSVSFSRTANALLTQYDVIEEKHADLRAGRALLRRGHHRYIGSEALHAGAHFEAAKHYLKGISQGDRGSLVRLPTTLLSIRAQRALRRKLMSDSAWLLAAAQWLEPYSRSDSDNEERERTASR